MTFSKYALLSIILTCILYGGKGIIECSRYLTLDWWFTIRLTILPEDPDCSCHSNLDLTTDMLNLLSHIEDEVNTHMELIDENL